MEGMIMTAQLLLSLSILIVVHEGGHFVAARMFNIRVEKFYLFFDFLFPMANVMNFALFKFKRGDTEYGIGWFPLGGYVKITGMVDESMDKEQLKQDVQPYEFRSKKPWQRLIVMMGGIIVNVIVGVLIFIGLTFYIGDTYIPKDYVNTHGGVEARELAKKIGFQTGDQIIKINNHEFDKFDDLYKLDLLLSQNATYTIKRGQEEITIPVPLDFIEHFNKREAMSTFLLPRVPAVVESVAKGSIASHVGLQKGDVFIEFNHQPVLYMDQVTTIKKSYTGDSLQFKVKRGEQLRSYSVYFKDEKSIGFYQAGIPKEELISINYSFLQSLWLGPGRAFDVIFVQLKAFKKIFRGDISFRKSLSGPIGMAQAYGGVWDWERFWRMTGLLSMVLAFMNFLPIPALDGGYVMFLIYEMITGKEPHEKVFETAIKIGMAIIMVLLGFTFYNDIAKLFE